jgi:outer membrane protein TolC
MCNLGRQCLARLSLSFFLWFGLIPAVRAQPVLDWPPARPSSPLTLEDCIRLGLERQPTLAAQRATVAAAEAQRKALDNLTCANLLSKELPIRKQQASCGVTIAQAGLLQAEWETTYAVERSYFTLVYAGKQEKLVGELIQILEDNRSFAQVLVKKAADPDLKITQDDVEKLAVNIDLLRLRLLEASSGVQRATAALKEAMGLRYDAPLSLAEEDLPPLGDRVELEQAIALALGRRGELVQACNAARITELEVSAQNTGCLLPFKKTFAAAADIHSREIPQGMNNSEYRPAAIGIEMPTTLVGHKSDRVERAQEFNSRAVAVVEKTQNLIALETADAFHKWQAAAGQVQALEQSVSKAANLRQLLAKRWQDNKVSTEEYLRTLGLLDQARSQLSEALFHHALAVAALERVTAGGLVPSYRRAAMMPK